MPGSARASRGARGVQSRPPALPTPSRNPRKTRQPRPVSLLTKRHEHGYTTPRRRTSVRQHRSPDEWGRVRSLTIRLNHNSPALCRRVRPFPAHIVNSLDDDFVQPLRARLSPTSTRTSQYVQSYVHPVGAKPLPPLHLPPRPATHETEQRVYCCASTGGGITVCLGDGPLPSGHELVELRGDDRPARLASGPRSFPALKAPDNQPPRFSLLPSNF